MKTVLLFKMFMMACALSTAQSVNITAATGWLESAYVTWEPVAGANRYDVFYSGNGMTDQQIDTQLIRSYGSYYRADIIGLAAGDYTFKIVPVTSNNPGAAAVTGVVTVMAHDRNGFAHEGGYVPGAYNLDGTLKDNAVVIYITENSKNTVTLNVTGANSNPCVGLQNILDGFKKGRDNRPLAIRLIGNITDLDYMINGDLVIENDNNANGSITFEGIGSDAVANGWGLRIKRGTNIEVRNLAFMLTDAAEGDNVGLQQDNDHVWVHNCDMFYGAPGGDADQSKGDGALDCKRSTYVTMSYNHFWDTGKSNLLGLSEDTTTGLYITYHHNWYDHSDSRHPRVRFYSAHIYNNYFDGNSKYGSGSTNGSSLFIEGNYFRKCKYPMLTSRQGTDISGGSSGTFSGEDGGFIKAFNNTISGQQRLVYYDAVNAPVQFDAYQAAARSEQIPSNLTSFKGNNAYNNFDTDASLYVNTISIDTPEDARDKVMQYSGRVSGGDITWTFNNAVDDNDSGVNSGLAALLQSYSTSVVSVQGDQGTNQSAQTLTIPNNNEQAVNSGESIEDMVFVWGGDATSASVSGLPSAGIVFTIDSSSKTVTISGTPTENVSFTVTTTGTAGSPVSGTGSIRINGVAGDDEVHNFTASGLTSNFYSFSGANINSTAGSTTYDGLTLTTRLKIESSTNISYSTSTESELTLVFDLTFNGTIKLDNTSYTASNGLLLIPSINSGSHQITKGSVANLFYIKTAYTLSMGNIEELENVSLYPNPTSGIVSLKHSLDRIERIEVYNVLGSLINAMENPIDTVDLRSFSAGIYLMKIVTPNGSITKRMIKK
ncbi:pectate lyase family protein [Nonlabens agnitus]|uniref:Pectate lyase n=1 Tax=Nonlabens agnitus TaxID=870484 RepID=A0A2S9WX78_9FLAO|nr:T9SS type A sorting domain-containing protein [Nonlabens agnitus]PRP68065.1 pectate lyase [Nonlabens agnitus]